MSEYWKSIPKKYCNFCKVWFQDNKSSVNFHERGLKHQANVQKHLAQVQKRGVQQAKELNDHEQEMRKIERAAMVSYQQDLIASGKSLPASSSSSIVNRLKSEEEIKEEKEEEEKKLIQGGGRFGDELRTEKSKKQALDMITKKMAKKHEWFESKTVEGKTYYYNRVTYGKKACERHILSILSCFLLLLSSSGCNCYYSFGIQKQNGIHQKAVSFR